MDFEKLNVWKRSVGLSVEIYKVMSQLRDHGFKDQITRSGLSVPSNIAEGMSRRSDRERIRFLDIAKSSAGELRTQTYIGMQIGYVDNGLGNRWISETKELSAMISGLMKRIEGGI